MTALFQSARPTAPARLSRERGQIIDTTLMPATIQHFTKEYKAQLEQGNIPADWNRQKELDASHTKKYGTTTATS